MMNTYICTGAGCVALLLTGAAATAAAQGNSPPTGQEVTRAGTQVSTTGPPDYFTGRVRVDPVWPANEQINASGALVTFEPGAGTLIRLASGSS